MSKPLVLIVDNDEDNVDYLDTLLDRFDTFIVNTAQEAVFAFEKNYLKIRVVLLRSVLPDMGCIELLQKLRAISTLPEVIVLADRKDIQLAVQSMKAGAFDFLVLPVPEEKLQNSISDAIDAFSYVEKMEGVEDNLAIVDQAVTKGLGLSEDLVAQSHVAGKSITVEDLFDVVPDDIETNTEIDFGNVTHLMDRAFKEKESELGSAHVLIVEDEAIYRKMMVDILKSKYEIHEAGNAHDVIRFIKTKPKVDVVLLDIFLPDINGTELVSVIKETLPDVEIVVITAFELIDKAVQVLRDGASNYLNKPILKSDLLFAVSKALQRKYFKSVLPAFQKSFLEKKLTFEVKIKLLNELADLRRQEKQALLMEDVYRFFPELKDTYIPDGLSLPEKIVNDGLAGFVENLLERSKEFNSGSVGL